MWREVAIGVVRTLMNDIDEFLAMMLAIFAGIILLMILLTYLETTLEPLRPSRRVLRKKAAPGRHR